MVRQRVKRTERGWPAHFCQVGQCIFRRNTLLGCGDERRIVSTVGNLRDKDGTGPMHTIGLRRYYETMVFYVCQEGPYLEADTGRQVDFDGEWALDRTDTGADLAANDMHEAAVAIITRQMRKTA